MGGDGGRKNWIIEVAPGVDMGIIIAFVMAIDLECNHSVVLHALQRGRIKGVSRNKQ